MTAVSDTLRAARELIAKPERWCKGAYAVNRAGEAIEEYSADVYARCVIGALYCGSDDGQSVSKAFMTLHRALPDGFLHIPAFNDHPDTTHPMIMDLFDRTIAMEEAA